MSTYKTMHLLTIIGNLPAMHYDRLEETALLLVETVNLRDKSQNVLSLVREPTATQCGTQT
jgi:hypothetical protein